MQKEREKKKVARIRRKPADWWLFLSLFIIKTKPNIFNAFIRADLWAVGFHVIFTIVSCLRSTQIQRLKC